MTTVFLITFIGQTLKSLLMRKIVSFSLLFLLLLSFVACGDDDKEDENVVPTTAFFLPEGCTWKKDLDQDKVLRIESMSELSLLVDVAEGAKLPEIDFEKKSMIMVASELANMGYRIDYKMWRTDDASYHLDIVVSDDVDVLFPAHTVYNLAVLTNKLDKNCSIDYDIQFP